MGSPQLNLAENQQVPSLPNEPAQDNNPNDLKYSNLDDLNHEEPFSNHPYEDEPNDLNCMLLFPE